MDELKKNYLHPMAGSDAAKVGALDRGLHFACLVPW